MSRKTVDQHKPWQHGYALDFLEGIEAEFTNYNKQIRSPFGVFKKNHAAAALNRKELWRLKDSKTVERVDPTAAQRRLAFFTLATAKIRSEIVMFMDIVIGVKEKGDKVIAKFVCKPGSEVILANYLKTITDAVWLYVLEEDEQQKRIAFMAGYDRVGVKINTHADIFGIYFKDVARTEAHRVHPRVDRYELLALQDLRVSHLPWFAKNLHATIRRLKTFDRDFSNHYSNYNKARAWSALSLRGYSADPALIEKPEDMSEEWNEERATEHFKLQNTPMAKEFPEAMVLAKQFAGSGSVHRVRFMRLKPGGGELLRHTDQVDKDLGIATGKLMRVHVPLKTNPKVSFTVWGVDGEPKTMNLPVGSAFYLDIRKPHAAINGGDEERIHLVMDLESTDHLRSMLGV